MAARQQSMKLEREFKNLSMKVQEAKSKVEAQVASESANATKTALSQSKKKRTPRVKTEPGASKKRKRPVEAA